MICNDPSSGHSHVVSRVLDRLRSAWYSLIGTMMLLVLAAGCLAADPAKIADASIVDRGSNQPDQGLAQSDQDQEHKTNVEPEIWQCVPTCAVGSCGYDGCGGYCDICNTEGDPRWDKPRYSLCDDKSHQCGLPVVECMNGWCFISSGSFLANSAEGLEMLIGHIPISFPAVISRSFVIQQTEVTVAMWEETMGPLVWETPFAACGPECPISGVSPHDAFEFANVLSASEGLEQCYELVHCSHSAAEGHLWCEAASFVGPDCNGYRLPSEMEWEYAASAGGRHPIWLGRSQVGPLGCSNEDITCQQAWYCANCEADYEGCLSLGGYHWLDTCCGPHPVGLKAPNQFGLFDTMGNVWELTGSDIPAETAMLTVAVDFGYTQEFTEVSSVVSKGGGWHNDAFDCYPRLARVAPITLNRGFVVDDSGFRLVRSVTYEDWTRRTGR